MQNKLQPEPSLPELTLRAILLALVLTVVLAGANAYLGLKVGMTISASIPAAVIALGVLRFFKNSNILESNIVQTAASAGEALAAGLVFTMPALIIIHAWTHFDYWHTMTLAVVGGFLGVLFSIPVRRVMLADELLRFPEGTAIGHVLKGSTSDEMGLKELIMGGAIGAMISLCQNGFKLFADNLQYWTERAGTIFGVGFGFDVALLGAGYIIGMNVCAAIFVGVLLGWVIGVPVIAAVYGYSHAHSYSQVALDIWSAHVRYIGLGAMFVGGLSALFSFFKPMMRGIAKSFQSLRDRKTATTVLRIERDIPLHYVGIAILLLLIPAYFLLNQFTQESVLSSFGNFAKSANVLGLVIALVLGFVISAICAYFAGLVGSSASSISSLVLIVIIITSFALVLLAGHFFDLSRMLPNQSTALAAVSIIITGIVSAAAAISNDTMQDLKAGHMVGATPWKQQVMLMVGVLVSALVIPLILQLLFNAYGMAGVFPRANMDVSQMLSAPQAGLMAAIVQAVFSHSINWLMMGIGVVIALATLVIDSFLKRYNLRISVLAVAMGIYLPLTTTMSLILGGVVSYFANHRIERCALGQINPEGFKNKSHHKGLLLACGLVAGAAVMGVLLAIPFAMAGSLDVLRLVPNNPILSEVLGAVVISSLCTWMVIYISRPS